MLVTHGRFIEGSGLREILEACLLATIGVGAVVNQVKRARYCIHVAFRSLYQKLVDAVKADRSTLDPWKWLVEKSLSSSMAHYRSLVTNFQIEILVFVRSIREGNFHLYVQSLRNVLKWFFALGYTYYARWLAIHVFNLISLPTTHSDVYQKISLK